MAGYFMATFWLGAPFVFAGTLKLAYDVMLYRTFRRTKPLLE